MSDLLITKWHGALSIIGLIDGKPEYLDIISDNVRTGNIYTGRVENKVGNLDSVFVRFENDKGKHGIGFLPMKDVPVKCVLNRTIINSTEIRSGDIVLVQVKVDEQKTKQARLTSKIKLSEDAFNGDIDSLIEIARTRCEYQLLYSNSRPLHEITSDAAKRLSQIDSSEVIITTDIKSVFEQLTENGIACRFYDEDAERISLFIKYSITSKTDDLFKKKVWLPSGGYLIIEQTETLNLIDVNSGKNLKKNDSFFLELNKEAAIEAYRQIRLRNLSGMILIDFVSMKDKDMSQALIDFVNELIAEDERHMNFIDLTGLGIMEFTRDKFKKTLKETIDYIEK